MHGILQNCALDELCIFLFDVVMNSRVFFGNKKSSTGIHLLDTGSETWHARFVYGKTPAIETQSPAALCSFDADIFLRSSCFAHFGLFVKE